MKTLFRLLLVLPILMTAVNMHAQVLGCTDPAALNFDSAATQDDGSCQYNVTLSVDMCTETVDTNGVYVAGTFNGFDATATQMTNIGGTVYSVTIQQATGTSLEYKFLNGPSFAGEETVPAACGIDNGFGAFDRGFTVPASDTTAALVAFGSCDTCVLPIDVTFIVNMCNEVVDSDGVYLAGSFNGFNPMADEMLPIGNDRYAVTVPLTPGQLHTYKYLNGPDFAGQESVPGACGVDNGFGAFDRSFTVPASDTTMGPVSFGNCQENTCSICEAGQLAHLITVTGGTFSSEIGWSLINSATGDTAAAAACGTVNSGTTSDTVCLDDAGSYCFVTYDDWGDGWNGGTVVISELSSGVIVISGSPNNGVPGDGSDACDGSQVEDSTCFTVSVIAGCTDSTAVNFNPNANLDDGSCLFAPPNDLCNNAVAVNCGDTISGTTVAATSDTSLATCGTDLTTAGGVWYVFAGDGSPVTASLCGSGYDTKIGVFSGVCDTLTCVAGNDDACGLQSEVTFASMPGTDYYIYVTGFGTNTGAFDLIISCDIFGCTDPTALNYDPLANIDDGSCVFPPANDSCAGAIAVACDDTITGNTIGASSETGLPFCGTALNTAPGLWYTYQGNGDTVTASMCGSSYDTKLGVFSGSCDSLECVGGNDDFCSVQSEVTFVSENGITYYLYVTGFAASAGDFTLQISCASPVATCDVPQNLMANSVTTTSAMLQWDAVPGAIGYEVNADAVGINPPGVVLVTSTNSISFNGLDTNTSYYFTVRAICDTMGTFLSDFAENDTFTTQSVIVCNVPQNLQAINITDAAATFTWSPVANVVSYNIIGNVVGGNPTSNFSIFCNDTSFTLMPLTTGGSYWWTVRSICDLSGTNVSAFAENDTFTTLSFACAVPQNLQADSISPTSALLTWDEVPDAIFYSVVANEVGGDPQSNLTPITPDNQYLLSGLIPGKTYWWTVKSVCDFSGTISALAPNDSFTTTTILCTTPVITPAQNVTSTSALLKWTGSALSFRVTGSKLGDPVVSFVTSAQEFQVNNLLPSTGYFWTVTSLCGDSTIASLVTDTFFTEAFCQPATNVQTIDIGPDSAVLSWTPSSNALGYRLAAAEVPVDPNAIFFKTINAPASSYTLKNLTPGKDYKWRIIAQCGYEASPLSPIVDFTTDGGNACAVPQNLFTDSITDNCATFNWDLVPGAVGYEINANAVGADSAFLFVQVVTGNEFDFGGLNTGTSYWWTVRAICDLSGTNLSDFAAPDTFTTGIPTCAVPDNLFSDSITTNCATLNWDPVAGALAYRAKGNAVGGNPIDEFNVLIPSGSLTEYHLTGLNPGLAYWWTVRSICDVTGTSLSDFAENDTFAVGTMKQINPASERSTSLVRVFPNPVSDKFYLQVPQPLQQLTITDVNGKIWLTKEESALNGSVVEVNSTALPSGVYFVRIDFAEEHEIKRVVVTRE